MPNAVPSTLPLDTFFKALADPTRLRILALLEDRELCVCDLQDSLRVPQPKTSRHLAYLKRAGLVRDRRQGLWVYYRLADDRLGIPRELLRLALKALGDAAHACCRGVPAETRGRAKNRAGRRCCGRTKAK
ncbi:MAG: winged helix-turn-helix transcriptional regulator [Acidobacteria bacterium]|nr:winged helix-turn-helix transcriptional regulator [Acidobacteriota bacterium]